MSKNDKKDDKMSEPMPDKSKHVVEMIKLAFITLDCELGPVPKLTIVSKGKDVYLFTFDDSTLTEGGKKTQKVSFKVTFEKINT